MLDGCFWWFIETLAVVAGFLLWLLFRWDPYGGDFLEIRRRPDDETKVEEGEE